MPRELPPPSTITPDDLWIVCHGSPRNPRPIPSLDSKDIADMVWMVLTSKKSAHELARAQRVRYGFNRTFVLSLNEFLVRRYDS